MECTAHNKGIWRNGGSNSAETAVQFLKFRFRANLSDPVTVQSRQHVMRHSADSNTTRDSVTKINKY
jgi:hypothetical protein